LGLLQEEVTVGGEVKELWDKLKKGASVLKLGKAIATSVITMSPDIDGFVDAFDKESDRIADTMESFEGDLKRLMELVKVDRIVVFIDDLDRCSSAKVIETFETIKLFLNTPVCTFVIGADAEKIKQAVGEVYSVEAQRQKDYLEKIVQIPFVIPAQDLRDIACYVGMLLVGRHLNQTALEHLSASRKRFYDSINVSDEFATWVQENKIAFEEGVTTVSGELSGVLPHIDVLARGLRGNPRQIKRFLNILSLRQQLGAANKLDTEPDLLVKFSVLEYVWDRFFTELAANVDPRTGKSELLGQLAAASQGNAEESKSDAVKAFLQEPGLSDFLQAEPRIDGETNLQPYLFLAQTSLGRSQSVGIVTIDESTKLLVKAIEGTDPIPSRAAASKAAQDGSVAGAVFRQLVNDLPAARSQESITNMLGAFETIGKAHPDLFKLVIKSLESLDGKGPAIGLAASTLLTAIEKAGTQVSSELKIKFGGASKIVSALSKPRTPRRNG
jgi:hypothetical protein